MRLAVTAGLLAIAAELASAQQSGSDREWPVTGGEAGNSRYSRLTQIDRTNVSRLQVAWIYRTGDASDRTQIQATPIVVRGVLYGSTPAMRAFALRAATGEELWRFDPASGRTPTEANFGGQVNRGLVYWEDSTDRRVFFSVGARLYALSAETGRPVDEFGDHGSVDLTAGLDRDARGQSVIATSPGVVYKDLLIQGTRVSEGDGAAPGHVRAYDARSGKIRWTFHTIPQPGEFGYDTWPRDAWKTAGGANSWPGMSVDVERGLVFVPTGSPSPDFYGGARLGADLFGNSLLALDAATGKRVWHFQTVHHDLWDRDLPAAPNLLSVVREGQRVDAVAQITKSGFVFLFDRATGRPLFSIEERAVAASTIPGERAWPTRPYPTKPEPFARQFVTDSDLTMLSPASHDSVLARFRALLPGGPYTPPSLEGSIVFPGFDGGGEWGGAAVDLESGVLYVNASDVPWIATLVPTSAAPTRAAGATNAALSGQAVYASACSSCHRTDRRGDGDRVPSLVNVRARLSAKQIRDVVDRGRGFMPGFASLPAAQRAAVVAYLRDQRTSAVASSSRQSTTPRASEPSRVRSSPRSPYQLRAYERWKDPDGYPAVRPPWGTLNAIDMNSGEYLWKIPLGEFPELTARGLAVTGTEQYGGPIVTAGGLVFIAATRDEKFRAFDKHTGRLLWETTLPAAGYATPATYDVTGKQFVVIAAGGGKLGTKTGDVYVAFALP